MDFRQTAFLPTETPPGGYGIRPYVFTAHMFQLDSFLFQLFFQIAGLDFRCDQIVLHIVGFPVFGFHILFEGIYLAFCFEIVVCNVQCKQCVLRIHRQAVVSG